MMAYGRAANRWRPTMSLPAQQPNTIPEQTARVARAIYPNGNPVMRLLVALLLVVTDSALLICSRCEASRASRRHGSHW